MQETSEKKSKWKCIVATKQFESKVDEFPMQTILAVSAQVDEIDPERPVDDDRDFDVKELSYRGPMYFDVDAADINAAIKSTNELVNKLITLGVSTEDIHVWATGKKGFHILLPQEVMGMTQTTRVRALPLVYREIATALFVEGLDMNVYSCGRGRMWRTPNFKRPDNGKYKVPISIAELENMDAKLYEGVTSKPRDMTRKYSGIPCMSMFGIFDQAKKNVARYLQELKENVTEISQEELSSFSADDGCIQKLITTGDDGRTNFNQAALQLAAFIKSKWRRDERDQWLPLVEKMAENVQSKTYNTPRDRKQHIMGAVHRVYADKNFKFARRALFKVIRPCGNCPICKSEAGEAAEVAELDCIAAEPTGYYASYGEGGAKQMTNFIIEPLHYFTSSDSDRGTRRTGIKAYLKWVDRSGKMVKQETVIDDVAWTSRTAMIKEVSGISNLVVYANDTEIQRLKYHVCKELDDITEVKELPSMGIHRFEVGQRYAYVYVEPDWSITSSWEQNTCKLGVHDTPAPPNFQEVPPPDWSSDEVKECLEGLFNMNSSAVVAQILGWVCACFIKPQITAYINQFPLLNLHGNAGSGKSKTAHLMGYLHGCDYEMRDSPLDLETATPYAITAMVSSSTTVMRILDECNPTLLKPATWVKLQGTLKAAWAGLEETKGMINNQRGVGVSRVKLSGPICYLSEQKPDRPAIRQRSIMVSFAERTRLGREQFFMAAFTRRKVLVQLGKTMMEAALTCKPEWPVKIMQEYAEKLPQQQLGARPLYSFTVVFAGLEFLKRVQSGLGLEFDEQIDDLITSLLTYVKDNTESLSKEKSRSESDIVIEAMATMAVQPEGSNERLNPEEHYFLRGNRLLIDHYVAFPFVSRFIRMTTGERAPVQTATQLESLLRGESYYLGDERHPIRPSNKVISLDVKLLAQRGVQVANFSEE